MRSKKESRENRELSKLSGHYRDLYFEYINFLAKHRGLKDSLWDKKYYIRKLFMYLISQNIDLISQIRPAIILEFITKEAHTMHRRTASGICQIIRGLLRYLYICGRIKKKLHECVPKPHIFREEGIPNYISWDKIQSIISKINQNTSTGMRDYAIILIMITYGFRSCEVANLRLSDIDWQKEQIRIQRGKCNRYAVYPLEREVGESLIRYLRKSRPKSSYRELFLKSIAPIYPFKSSTALTSIVSKYLKLAGIKPAHMGTHVLRHSCAKRLVDKGFSLKAIGDYLGHTNPESTHIYTKIATNDLFEVANSDAEDLI